MTTQEQYIANHNRSPVMPGGNLFDDIQVHVMTMTVLDDENHPAESTRIHLDDISIEEEVTKTCEMCSYECILDSLMLHHINDHHNGGFLPAMTAVMKQAPWME
jgi:hypothetical protein